MATAAPASFAQQYPAGHLLVIPRRHTFGVADLDEAALQEVFHCHLHGIARYRGDRIQLRTKPGIPPRPDLAPETYAAASAGSGVSS